jgi:hypothetical protein
MNFRNLAIAVSMTILISAGSAARGQDQPPPPPPTDTTAPPAPSLADQATSSGAREMLRLKQAGYSEEFLLKKVEREKSNYQLTTDDLILLRKAGFSEKLIEAMLISGRSSIPPADAVASSTPAAGSPAPASSTPASTASPAAAPDSGISSLAMTPAPLPGHMEFDGLVRQTGGFLGVGGSKTKHVGKLVVDGQKFNWYEEADPEQNFSMYTKNVKEMWLNCAPRSGENLCLEVGLKNYQGDEWTFRDTGWANGENRQVTAIYDYFQKAYPADFFSKREKKSF